METQDYILYAGVLALTIFLLRHIWRVNKMKGQIPEWLHQGAVIIDVRTAEEFQLGAHPQSQNIPLASLESKYKSLDRNKTYLLCCASGARSAAAVALLRGHGFTKVHNVGAWQNTMISAGF